MQLIEKEIASFITSEATFAGNSVTVTINGTPPTSMTALSQYSFRGSTQLSFGFIITYDNPGTANTTISFDYPYEGISKLLPNIDSGFTTGYLGKGDLYVYDDITTQPIMGDFRLVKGVGTYTIEGTFASTNVKRITGRVIFNSIIS